MGTPIFSVQTICDSRDGELSVNPNSSCPDLFRASTSFLPWFERFKTWMTGSSPGMTSKVENPMRTDPPKTSPNPEANRDHTDWARVDALTDEEIEAAVRDDLDVAPELDEEWFASATLVTPRPKEQISIRLDRDVLEHFRRYPRWQTRITAILRAVMEHEKKTG